MAGWKVKVLNVVATGFLNHPLDLRLVREKVKPGGLRLEKEVQR